MPKYLVEFSYTLEGAKGLRKEGGSARRAATETLIQSLGGKLEAYYFLMKVVWHTLRSDLVKHLWLLLAEPLKRLGTSSVGVEKCGESWRM